MAKNELMPRPPAQGCFSTRAIASSTRPSLLSSPPPIPSDSATDRLRAVCSHCRSSASFISRDSWGCATISLGSEKIAVGSRRAVAKLIVDDAWPIHQSSLEGSQRMRPLLPIEDYAMGRLSRRARVSEDCEGANLDEACGHFAEGTSYVPHSRAHLEVHWET